MSAPGKLRSFLRLSAAERRLALSCLGWVWLVRVGLWMLPFRRMQRLCEAFGRSKVMRLPDAPTAAQIVWGVRLASRNVPRATCLTQALAAEILMGRNGYSSQVRIGVAVKPEAGFRAHAWLEHEGRVLIGETGDLAEYTPLMSLNNEFTVQELRR